MMSCDKTVFLACLTSLLWSEYVDFLVTVSLTLVEVVRNLCNRGIRKGVDR